MPDFRYLTTTPEQPPAPRVRLLDPLRYGLYVLGIKFGNPPSKPGTRVWPLDFEEWRRWMKRGW